MRIGTLFVACAAMEIAGCSAMLDLQRAELKVDAGAIGQTGASQLTSECTQAGDECLCREACATERAACLADKTCRSVLESYSECLGQDCRDEADGACLENVSLSYDNSRALALGDCLSQRCEQLSCRSPIATLCERFCGCMLDDVTCKITGLSAWKYESFESCMKECQQVPLRTVRCRLAHCEFATAHNTVHCGHALAREEALDQCALLDLTVAPACLTSGDVGEPCAGPEDCCQSLLCRNSICQ